MGKYVKENLSQLVRRVIREKKLSLRQVQELSGGQIEKSYISRIMTGNVKNITLEKLVALARGLDMDPHILFSAYYFDPRPAAGEPLDVIELSLTEFTALMQKVAVNPKFVEIVEEVVQLHPGEQTTAMLNYAMYLNGRKRAARRGKESLPRQATE
ncbi:MAG: helix-turn-helix domain-containing protein [Blastocatellia bacterium]